MAGHKAIKRRPLGVWILTISALFYVGVYRLHPTTILNLLKGHTAMFSKEDIPVLSIYAFLKISIVVASALTLSGVEIGRRFFLFLVPLYFLGDGIYSLGWGIQFPNSGDVRGWIWYLMDFVFPIVCIWYFNKSSTKEFFRKELGD